MKTRMPSVDARRAAEFEAELLARARSWLPEWGVDDDPQDFGRALLAIAARFDSEVAEQLDRVGEKMHRGLVDWLGVRANAARPARMPVVMRMGERAVEPVLARAPVRLQADAGGASVVFETEGDVRVMPGRLEAVVAVDADQDAIFVPTPDLTRVEPAPPAPDRWRVETDVGQGSTVLQLNPGAGLVPGMLIEAAGRQYRVEQGERDIVTLSPPLADRLAAGTPLNRVTSFTPFDSDAENQQLHALYIGHLDLLNLESEATIDVVGAQGLAVLEWKYWGKVGDGDVDGWWPMTLANDQPVRRDAVRLKKRSGTVEPRGVGAVAKSRWIAAFSKKVDDDKPLLTTDQIALRINYGDDESKLHPKCPIEGAAPANPPVQALANSTPLVLSGTFYPLGKTPRQFDAFYLGCTEAFSKQDASVQLCVGLADPTFASLSAVRGGANFADRVVAGVAEDRALHLYTVDAGTGNLRPMPNRDALQPPRPGLQGTVLASPAAVLTRKPGWRLPTWPVGDDFAVAVAAELHVWAWVELWANAPQSGWLDLGVLPPGEIVALAALDVGIVGFHGLLALQAGGVLSVRIVGIGDWAALTPEVGGDPVVLTTLAPVLRIVDGRLAPSDRCVGVGTVTVGAVTSPPTLYVLDGAGTCTPLLTDHISDKIQPVAFDAGGELCAVALRDTLDELVMARLALPETTRSLDAGMTAVDGSLELFLAGSEFTVLAVLSDGTRKSLASWAPRAATAAGSAVYASPVTAQGEPSGTATQVAGHVILPGNRADVVVARLDLSLRLAVRGRFGTGIVMPSTTPALALNDVVVARVGGAPRLRRISGTDRTRGSESFQPLDDGFGAGVASGDLAAYRYTTADGSGAARLNAMTGDVDQLALAPGDRRVSVGMRLLVQDNAPLPSEFTVDDVDTSATPWVATLSGALQAAAADIVAYWLSLPTEVRVAPFALLDPSDPQQRVDADVAERAPFVFQTARPSPQHGTKVFARSGTLATLLVFAEAWVAVSAPANGAVVDFVVNGAVGEWQTRAGAETSNPELSWEYWNGAWSQLEVEDHTANLKSTGALVFTVPTDIRATDWAGKTDHWIRARLVGGDYGTESVEVHTETLAGGRTVQTIVRSSDGIKPPAIVSLAITYAVDREVLPDFVLAEDSGTVRDQSDANRTPSASVEAFVPLSITLGRLQRDAAPAGAAAGAADEVTPASGRSLFLGFSSPLAGASVNVLSLAAREVDLDAFAPLRVEALAADRFTPVTTQDGSRALGETGLLSFAFGDAPTQAELFGRALRWLRIAPASSVEGRSWSPSLAGLYLNAVWASATETLTRERVGSSEGAPGLVLRLARPPLLERSLELRVREPLGDEERAALLAGDPRSVLADPDLPGDWVLWRAVNDPADCDAEDRVYALDEGSGEIRFGDGTNGLIAPIGRDNIVAFSYQRTEPPVRGAVDVPANTIPARAQVNLVTAVEGVEAVYAADHAAGGSPPEPDASVLRHATSTLRHRGRALSLDDFEDLALATSPRIAQARAWQERGAVRLVVAMEGSPVQPGAAQCRELRRHLLALAPASLGGALKITGPRERQLRVVLRVRVDSLERAGAVRDDCAARLLVYLDAARGAADGEGWPIGLAPRELDIVRALDGVASLQAIEALSLAEVLGGEGTAPWPAALRAGDLVRLADKDVRVSFTAEQEPAT